MINESLVIMLLGTGLMVGAARVRRWHTTQAQEILDAGGKDENSRAKELSLSRLEHFIVEAGADLP